MKYLLWTIVILLALIFWKFTLVVILIGLACTLFMQAVRDDLDDRYIRKP